MTDDLTQDQAAQLLRQTFEPGYGWAGQDIIRFLDSLHEEFTTVANCGWTHRADIARYVCTCPAGVMVLTTPANVAGNAWRN